MKTQTLDSLPKIITICITGLDGSGKSTLTNSLVHKFNSIGLKAREVSIWDLLHQNKNHFFDKESVSQYLCSLENIPRSFFLFHCLLQSVLQARKESSIDGTKILFFNAYWYKYFATEIVKGGNKKWLKEIVKVFPETDLTLYLDIPISLCIDRKKTLSVYEGKHEVDPKTKFSELLYESQKIFNELINEQWIKLDATADAAELLNEAFIKIKQHLDLK